MTRAFVAIPMPEDAAARLAGLARGLPVGRRVAEDNLHLTIAFLGEVRDEALDELDGALGAVRSGPVELRFEGLGTFGGARPRTLFASVAAQPALLDLRRAVNRAVRQAGLEPDAQRFVPHVTLARLRGHAEEAAALGRFLADRGGASVPPVRAVAFSLMSSRLKPDGAVYDELGRYPMIG